MFEDILSDPYFVNILLSLIGIVLILIFTGTEFHVKPIGFKFGKHLGKKNGIYTALTVLGVIILIRGLFPFFISSKVQNNIPSKSDLGDWTGEWNITVTGEGSTILGGDTDEQEVTLKLVEPENEKYYYLRAINEDGNRLFKMEVHSLDTINNNSTYIYGAINFGSHKNHHFQFILLPDKKSFVGITKIRRKQLTTWYGESK